MPPEGSLEVESAPEPMPVCDAVELPFFFVCSVIDALMGVEVAATAPAATANGVYVIWRYVVTKGLRVPSVVVQTASVVLESEQSPA